MSTAKPEDEEGRSSRAYLIVGVSLLAIAGGLYVYSRSRPCGCGEKGVEDIAQASAEMQEGK
jgi:hypothetical protein